MLQAGQRLLLLDPLRINAQRSQEALSSHAVGNCTASFEGESTDDGINGLRIDQMFSGRFESVGLEYC